MEDKLCGLSHDKIGQDTADFLSHGCHGYINSCQGNYTLPSRHIVS